MHSLFQLRPNQIHNQRLPDNRHSESISIVQLCQFRVELIQNLNENQNGKMAKLQCDAVWRFNKLSGFTPHSDSLKTLWSIITICNRQWTIVLQLHISCTFSFHAPHSKNGNQTEPVRFHSHIARRFIYFVHFTFSSGGAFRICHLDNPVNSESGSLRLGTLQT